jgi:hypothetical protein
MPQSRPTFPQRCRSFLIASSVAERAHGPFADPGRLWAAAVGLAREPGSFAPRRLCVWSMAS